MKRPLEVRPTIGIAIVEIIFEHDGATILLLPPIRDPVVVRIAWHDHGVQLKNFVRAQDAVVDTHFVDESVVP